MSSSWASLSGDADMAEEWVYAQRKNVVESRDALCDDRAYMASSKDARPPSRTRTRKLRPRWLLCKS